MGWAITCVQIPVAAVVDAAAAAVGHAYLLMLQRKRQNGSAVGYNFTGARKSAQLLDCMLGSGAADLTSADTAAAGASTSALLLHCLQSCRAAGCTVAVAGCHCHVQPATHATKLPEDALHRLRSNDALCGCTLRTSRTAVSLHSACSQAHNRG
jgi:hypothetical protein